jgi:hypothetical protein
LFCTIISRISTNIKDENFVIFFYEKNSFLPSLIHRDFRRFISIYLA